jgi:hypothetical protein
VKTSRRRRSIDAQDSASTQVSLRKRSLQDLASQVDEELAILENEQVSRLLLHVGQCLNYCVLFWNINYIILFLLMQKVVLIRKEPFFIKL